MSKVGTTTLAFKLPNVLTPPFSLISTSCPSILFLAHLLSPDPFSSVSQTHFLLLPQGLCTCCFPCLTCSVPDLLMHGLFTWMQCYIIKEAFPVQSIYYSLFPLQVGVSHCSILFVLYSIYQCLVNYIYLFLCVLIGYTPSYKDFENREVNFFVHSSIPSIQNSI